MLDSIKEKLAKEFLDSYVEKQHVNTSNKTIECVEQYPYEDNFKRLAYRHIEKCARVCYASEPKSDDFVYTEKFITSLSNRKHYSPFAHATIYLKEQVEFCPNGVVKSEKKLFRWFDKNPWSRVVLKQDQNSKIGWAYITTNWRVYMENKEYLDSQDIFKYETKCEQFHKKRLTFLIDGEQISIIREFNRHGFSLSICEQSTRWCNYSDDGKFGGVKFSIPHWWNDESIENLYDRQMLFKKSMVFIDKWYNEAIELGMKPEDARWILNLGVSTKVAYTGFEDDWLYVIGERTSKTAHPDAQILANKINEFIKKS